MATFSNILGAEKGEKGQNIFYCEKCDFKCCKKYSWDRHLLTSKHDKATKSNILATENGQKGQKNNLCCNNCGKEYYNRTGLWRHNKKCIPVNTQVSENKNIIDKDLVEMLIKQNTKLMEIIENGTTNNSNNIIHTNSHNKSFNLNFFLNETCKNAMNIMDFVDSIKLQLSDLEKIGELGYVDGISNIIVKNLNELDVTERPIHCTDSKRETIYIKDEDKWEKENENKIIVKKAVKKIANKNISLLPEFKAKYPDCIYSDSKKSDQYNKIIIEAFELNNPEKQDKVIKNIVKKVIVDKK